MTPVPQLPSVETFRVPVGVVAVEVRVDDVTGRTDEETGRTDEETGRTDDDDGVLAELPHVPNAV